MLMLFYVLTGLLLLILHLAWRKNKKEKRERNWQENDPKEKRRRMVEELKQIERFEPNGYEGSTKETIVRLQKTYGVLVEDLFSNDDSFDQRAEKLKEEEEFFKEKLKQNVEKWDQLEKAFEQSVEALTGYIEQTNFYPPDFIHDTNRLQRRLEELRDKKRKDPISSMTTYQDEKERYEDKIANFKRLHKETNHLIAEIEREKGRIEEKTMGTILTLKNDLFLNLQMGQIKEGEGKINKIKEILKETKKPNE